MKPIPKGSSISVPDRAFLGTESVLSDRCIFCGAKADEDHHQPPKSRIPKAMHHLIPTFSACAFGNHAGKCHALLHGNGGRVILKPTTDPRYAYAIADEFAAADINKRRKRHGLPKIRASVEFLARGEES